MWIRLIILLGIALPASAEDLFLTGPGPTGCALQRDDLMRVAHEKAEKPPVFAEPEQCDSRICRGGPPPVVGQVTYKTPYGDQVVNYGD